MSIDKQHLKLQFPTMDNDRKLLSAKELAFELNRHINYIYAMKRAGFIMPAGRATLENTLRWLIDNPDWRRKAAKTRELPH